MSPKKVKSQQADMLLNKRDELLKCMADFEQAVSLITRMVNGLEQTNTKISKPLEKSKITKLNLSKPRVLLKRQKVRMNAS